MKLDGGAIEYLLAKEYGTVVGSNIPRLVQYDYPILYDDTSDMSGHTALVPAHEKLHALPSARTVLYVCLGAESAQSARDAGLAVLFVDGDIPFRQLYNYMQRIFVRNERLEAQLRAYVDTFMGFQPLVEACAREMECTFALVDRQYQHIAHASFENGREASDSAAMLEAEAIDLFMASRNYRFMRASHNVFTMPGSGNLLMKNLFDDGLLVGTLIARHNGTTPGARYVRFLLNYLCGFAEEMYAQIGSFGLSSASAKQIHAALELAATGQPAACTTLTELLQEDGHEPNGTYMALRIERSFTNEGPEDRDYLARRFEFAWPQAYCFTVENKLFMLAALGSARPGSAHDLPPELFPLARDNLCKIGISRPFSQMELLARACTQASMALSRGNEIDPVSWSYRFDNYALEWLLGFMRADKRCAIAGHPALEILADYDREHNSDLLETLRTFMDCRYNATDAAKALFVARSTLLNRLERIAELTGFDFDDKRARLHLALSFELI